MNYWILSSYPLPTNCDRPGFVAAGSERVVAADVADTVVVTLAVDTLYVNVVLGEVCGTPQ